VSNRVEREWDIGYNDSQKRKGKLAERQGRKAAGLRWGKLTMAAGPPRINGEASATCLSGLFHFTWRGGMAMSLMDLHSLNNRNKLMLILCWGLTVIGALSALAIGQIKVATITLMYGVVSFVLPSILVWKQKLDRLIMYWVALVFALYGYLMQPTILIYMWTFLYVVFLSLYFDYRPIILMGIANVIYTIYFVIQSHDAAFLTLSDSPIRLILSLVGIHLLVTCLLIMQSIFGQRLRSNSLLMERLSKTDALTGLFNHKMFYEYLEQTLRDLSEGRLTEVHLAIIDIDNFKQINDSYGHATGDLIVRRVAEAIRNNKTSSDFVARYGGEEFAIIFRDKNMQQACQIAENIRIELANLHHPEIGHKPVTISIGLKQANPKMSKSELFERADELMYAAKRQGKNRTVAESDAE
jgi:diguanylate cyclase (GGDEF)-like protein